MLFSMIGAILQFFFSTREELCSMLAVIMSHSFCGDILFCWRSVFIQATKEWYISLESVWRGDLKKCRFVRLSVCPFVTLTKNYFFIIDSRKIIRISGEKAYYPLQENEAIFKKYIFLKNLDQIFEKLRICIKMPAPPSVAVS